jgi:diaminohydroxyphosphoribosylaminopyrimidine deaminase/5-amino-6-(5-phosphoribosylamino)uracil reductase
MRTPAALLNEEALARLLDELAREASVHRFEVAPNPCVGAALLAGAEVVARGVHRWYGGPHAEIEAMRAAGAKVLSADTLVVTLEPCSSHGKTPPCVDAILAAGIGRVVVGALDPDPRHRGRGIELLREKGLEVALLEGVAPLAEISPHFLHWTDNERLRRPRPWTIAKWAQTRTGQLVPPEGVGGGRWISSHAALEEVAVLRGRVDAIVTGVGTVVADDPRLTVRPPGDTRKPPLRVILDSRLRTPPSARILKLVQGESEAGGRAIILCIGGADPARHHALLDAGAEVHELHVATDDGVDLRDVQRHLWEELGVRRVLLEAGPILTSHYLSHGFVDQVRVYTGSVNGGRGPTLASELLRQKLAQRLDREVGPDAVFEAFVDPRGTHLRAFH